MKLTVSLSRAHKIAERIKTRMNELFAEATALMGNQTVGGVGGLAQVEKLEGMAAKGLVVFEQALQYSGAFAQLRAAIGAENEKRGVSAKMAELEALNRAMGAIKAILSASPANSITPAELGDYKPLNTAAMRASISVAVMTPEQVKDLKGRQAQLQREAFALSDRINELNAPAFAIELPDIIGAEVTGG